MNVVLLSLLLICELTQQADLVNFILFSRPQKSHFEHFEREIDMRVIACHLGSFSLKVV